MQVRLQKFLSSAGIASRRNAEQLIERGSVKVNGKIATLGMSVDPYEDIVTVKGKFVDRPESEIYILMYKPKRYVTTREDKFAKRTVFDLLPKMYKQMVWPVGRLDRETEGALLFTNDGDLTQLLTHPRNNHEKEYELTLETMPTAKQLRDLRTGVFVKGKQTQPAKARIAQGKVFVTITEGKKHQILLMCKAVGLQIKNLKRVRIGKLVLPKHMKPGDSIVVKRSQIV